MFNWSKKQVKSKKPHEKSNNLHKPIIFMNTPITNDENDVIGIHSAVSSVKEAIFKDAKMIGIIADYGSGKSSLTETLARDEKSYGKAIHINMWDSISKLNKQETTGDAINLLTKSFVFQLASGVSEHCAKHINRRLSKNFGILSFSISSWIFWLWAGLAAVAYIIYAGITLLKIDEIEQAFVLLNDRLSADVINTLAVGIKASAPLFMVLGIILAIIGLRKTTVAFSKWQSNNPREVEINDVFEAYIYIHKKLSSYKFHRLIIIEDLDRIENKNLVVGFLKEIYRFSSLSLSQRRKKPVFIVSVMPESHLRQINDSENPIEEEYTDKDIYSKIFDYTISLKPIHFTDYAEIILNIIHNEGLENLILLQKLLGYEPENIIRDKHLPKSFDWITTGHNLTIRQLKDRLNSAVSLLVTLKNKGYKNQSYINFSACAAVTYLEHQYPELFGKFLKNEEILSDLVRKTYKAKNSENCDVENAVNEILKSNEISKENENEFDSFKKDITKMLKAGDISDDFRIYFYSFPKNSYIKNSDERDICNLLLLPNDYTQDLELDEKIERLKYRHDAVFEALERINKDNEIKHYPKIIFEHWFLFRNAYEKNPEKVKNSICHFALWDDNCLESSKQILSSLLSIYVFVPKEIWDFYSQRLSIKFFSLDAEARIKIRKHIIPILGERIELFKGLFYMDKQIETNNDKPDFTIISEEELTLFSTKELGTLMINAELINENNFKYIADYVNSFKSYNMPIIFDKATDIITSMVHNVGISLCWKECIRFLKNNEHIDDELFALIISAASKSDEDKAIVGDYLSTIQISSITEKYLKLVDESVIDVGLSQDILSLLYKNKLFSALLSFLAKNSRLNYINFTNAEDQPKIIDAINRLLNYDISLIPVIRLELINQFSHNNNLLQIIENYNDIFYDDYPIITKDEMEAISDVSTILKLLNRTKVNIDNFKEIVSEINKKSNPKQCMEIFDLLLSTEYTDSYLDNTIVINILNNLEYEKLDISNLSTEEKKLLTDLVGEYQDFSNPANARSFIEKAKCLFPELEKVVVGAKKEHYIELINQVDKPSEFTMKWLDENDVYFELPQNILNNLLKQKSYQKYLVGKVLKEKSFSFPYPNVPDEIVLNEYTLKSPIWPYVQNNIELINQIIKNKLYENYSKSDLPILLPFLYQGNQCVDFAKFVLAQVPAQERTKYLRQMGEIAGDENSVAISKLLLQSAYIGLLEKDDIFNIVKERLWEDVNPKFKGYKSSFTRKRNEYFRK